MSLFNEIVINLNIRRYGTIITLIFVPTRVVYIQNGKEYVNEHCLIAKLKHCALDLYADVVHCNVRN